MLKTHTHEEIKKAVIRSQHTQRNWDLGQKIPKEDLNTLLHSVTNCPSKQNVAFYKVHFIQDRDMIEEIHEHPEGFGTYPSLNSSKHVNKAGPVYIPVEKRITETNPQTLANLLVIFEKYDFLKDLKKDFHRNMATREYNLKGQLSDNTKQELERDRQIALGIAAGYLNLTAALMGYRTGCCQCGDFEKIREIALLEDMPLLLMGVGFPQKGVNRKKHHIRDFTFVSKKKQPIKYKIWD